MEGITRFLAKMQCVIKLFVKMANRRCTLSTVYTCNTDRREADPSARAFIDCKNISVH